MTHIPTVYDLQKKLINAEITSEQLVSDTLNRIQNSDEGNIVFTQLYADQALQQARASDALRATGIKRSSLEGLPVSIKDLFDVSGQVTTAGSVVLAKSAPVTETAPVVQRLIDAGAIIVGRTNMTEFAFSGLGINPHYGSPSSPWDRGNKRISGGSSSGAGVAVAEQMSVMSLGTDTGGSIRIPAAFCGITGFKPTARLIPSTGSVPLSYSMDSSGPLAASVQCCATSFSIMAGIPEITLQAPKVSNLRFAIPDSIILDDAEPYVVHVFEQTIKAIETAGAKIDYISIPEFEKLAYINRKGGLTAAEAWFWHRNLAETSPEKYDPRVISRIMRGKSMSAADYIEVKHERAAWIKAVEKRIQWYDAILMPTTPIVAPTIRSLEESDDEYFPANMKILRNPTFINFLDGCALSIPCHKTNEAPVGLMIAGPALHDQKILECGYAIQQLLSEL